MRPNQSTAFAVALAFTTLSTTVAIAAGPKTTTHGGSSKPTTTTSHGPSAKTHGPSTTKPHGPSSTTHGPSTAAHGPASTPGAPVKTTNPKKSTTTTTATTASTSTTTSSTANSTTSTTTKAWTPDNPVAQKLSTKSNLLTKVKGTLPAGTDLNAATADFKNFGQFIAAVNVSKNLGIPFEDLKAAMTGTTLDGKSTGKAAVSLGQAIRQTRGDVNPTAEAQKATSEAEAEIGSTSTTSSAATGKKSGKPTKATR